MAQTHIAFMIQICKNYCVCNIKILNKKREGMEWLDERASVVMRQTREIPRCCY
jgi:hypothetical protein